MGFRRNNGIVKHLKVPIKWSHIHWHVPKSVLLKRTEDWNKALVQYCDDAGLSGEYRDEIVSRHKASLLAQCASINCTYVKTKLKE